MNFHFFQSVNFSSNHGNLSFKKRGLFRKKIEFLFFFSKNNHFGKKLSTEPQSLFERASLPYFLFFNFPISKSNVWLYRLDNTYTGFRAFDRFCFLDPQISKLWVMNCRSILSLFNKKYANIFFFTIENKYKGALLWTGTLIRTAYALLLQKHIRSS